MPANNINGDNRTTEVEDLIRDRFNRRNLRHTVDLADLARRQATPGPSPFGDSTVENDMPYVNARVNENTSRGVATTFIDQAVYDAEFQRCMTGGPAPAGGGAAPAAVFNDAQRATWRADMLRRYVEPQHVAGAPAEFMDAAFRLNSLDSLQSAMRSGNQADYGRAFAQFDVADPTLLAPDDRSQATYALNHGNVFALEQVAGRVARIQEHLAMGTITTDANVQTAIDQAVTDQAADADRRMTFADAYVSLHGVENGRDL